MRETASVRRQAPRNVASSLDSARELGIRDAQVGSSRIPTVGANHSNVARRQCGVGLDAFDEGRAARTIRKPAFDQDHVRALFGDGVERAQRVGVLERARLALDAARFQGGQVLNRADHDRRGHSLRV